MAHNHRILFAEGVDNTDVVANVIHHPIGVDIQGSVRTPIATHIDGSGSETGGRNRGKLMPPRVPGLGKSVYEEYERALTHLGHMDSSAIGADDVVLESGHGTNVVTRSANYRPSI